MGELQAIYNNKTLKVLTNLEMVAAEQLMQLSDVDNSSSSSIDKKRKSKSKIYKNDIDGDERKEEEFDRISQEEITSKKKIEEIFGKEEEEIIIIERPRKKKYKSIESIYKTTKPIKVRYEKNYYDNKVRY